MREFVLERAGDTVEALRRAAARTPEDGNMQYLAGGTNLLDLMKLDVMRPNRLVDIAPLAVEHGRVRKLEDGLWLGAAVKMSQAADDPDVQSDYPVIAQSLTQAASAQLRNMATLGGNVLQRTRCNYFRDTSWGACNKREPGTGCAAMDGCNRRLAVLGVSDQCIANYPGDFAQALIALGAEVNVFGTDGRDRTFAFETLHRLPGDTPHIETTLEPGDLITGFKIPAGPWTRRSRYVKVRDRTSYDFALASAAVALALDGDRVVSARIALGGLASVPWRAHAAEDALEGRVLSEANAQGAAAAALEGAVAHGDNAFKVELGGRTLVRALVETRDMEIMP
ncbi:MAG: xanthine dehydrogenase family protein subunit M [Sphingobium sp.]|uniref:FAD binding domain-containing protein n=1 Tax=Sphingobium sp. TaxID=1912891 RepID=UPI0029A2C4C7|nr:xanthine dehydrogenase family protein subunit M [Sphingobium sp.]MDX3911119.1 xanthine dehydrogenase family protein subunit M [Sphingobium sp.]